MHQPLFLPTARQTNWLLTVAFLAVGEALYIRYMAIENVNTALACQAGLNTWLCASLRISVLFYNDEIFGGVALALALLNFVRPAVLLVAITLAVAGFGVVLHNADLSALAMGLLILSLARPASAKEQTQGQ